MATDRSIIDNYDPSIHRGYTHDIEDLIEIYFDTKQDRFEICSPSVKHFLLSPNGFKYRSEYYDIAKSKKIYDVNSAIVVHGTINSEQDDDCGYSIELAIPWEGLGVRPSNELMMGFEVCNCDKDFVAGNFCYSGWTTTQHGLKNPSTWGTIVFVNDREHVAIIMYAVLAGCLLAGAYLIIRKSSVKLFIEKKIVTEQLHIDDEYINKALTFIGDHYGDTDFSREAVAAAVGMTPSYFGKYFKKRTNQTFTDYVNSIRIKNAKQLLLSTSKNISEISLDIGFENPSYFCSVFKKIEQTSPKEFRKSHRVPL